MTMTTEQAPNRSLTAQTQPDTSSPSITYALSPLFLLGQVVATPGALEVLDENHCLPLDLLQRHLRGDWGDVPPEDAKANRDALKHGARILSSYPMTDGAKVWIITEADRSATTFLLPEEY